MEKIISIILPCYNEWEKIYENMTFLYDFLKLNFIKENFEFVLINDWSSDNTGSEIKKLETIIPNSKIISYKKNVWKWYAIKKWLEISTWEIIACYDSDLDISPDFLVEHIEFLIKNPSESIVIWTKQWAKNNVPIKRKIISSVHRKVNSILFSLPINDTQTGLKVFRKNIKKIFLKKVKTSWYAFDVDFLYNVVKKWYKINSLPIKISINNLKSWVNFFTILTFLKEIIFLYRKIQFKLKTKKLILWVRIKLFFIKCFIFPIEKIINLIFLMRKKKVYIKK